MSNSEVFYNGEAVKNDFIAHQMGRVLGKMSNHQIQADQAIPTLGSFLTFRIPKQGKQFVTGVNLVTVVSAVTKTGGTYVRLVDAFGLMQLDRIEMWQDGGLIQTSYADVDYAMIVQNNDANDYPIMQANLGIASTTARNTAAAAAQTFTLELDECFSLLAQPLAVWLLNSDIELRVYFKSSVNVLVQTDGTAPSFTYQQCYLSVEYTEPYGLETIKFVEDLAQRGFIMFGYDQILNSYAIGTGTTQYQFNLSQINNKNVILMNYLLRTNSDLSTALACNYTNLQQLLSYSVKSASNYVDGQLFDTTDTYFRQTLISQYHFMGRVNLISANIYSTSYSDELDETFGEFMNKFTGCRSFYGVSDAQLTVNFASNVAAAMTISVCVLTAQRYLIKGGKLWIMV